MQQAVIAQRLRTDGGGGEGLAIPAIAREMGISVSYASELLSDPTGEKARARKRKYLGRCKTCSKLCYGSYCRIHYPASQIRSKWTEEAVIEAIQEWEIMYGRPPILKEWYRRGNLPEWVPLSSTVYKVFGPGGWNKAIAAAGFSPRLAEPPDHVKQSNNIDWTPERRRAWGERMAKRYAENADDPQFAGLRQGQNEAHGRYLRYLHDHPKSADDTD